MRQKKETLVVRGFFRKQTKEALKDQKNKST